MISAIKLEKKTNLNEVLRSGTYYYSVNSNIINCPSGKESSWGLLCVIEEEEGQYQQILISFGNLYFRQRLEIGGWSPWTNLSSGTEAFSLNPASTEKLGGVIVGSGLNIDDEGILTAEKYKLPMASKEQLGGIRVGDNLSINSAGVLSANYQVYCLPYATKDRLGGIKLGSGLEMDDNGQVCVKFPENNPPQIISTVEERSEYIENPYSLPIASESKLGGIKIGRNLTISEDGTLSANDQKTSYVLPKASKDKFGGIKLDGDVFSLTEDGYLRINKDRIIEPKEDEKKKEFSYEINEENYVFGFSLEEQIKFLNQVILATMSQSGILGGFEGVFKIEAKKEKSGEEVILSLDIPSLLDLYVNGFNSK